MITVSCSRFLRIFGMCGAGIFLIRKMFSMASSAVIGTAREGVVVV